MANLIFSRKMAKFCREYRLCGSISVTSDEYSIGFSSVFSFNCAAINASRLCKSVAGSAMFIGGRRSPGSGGKGGIGGMEENDDEEETAVAEEEDATFPVALPKMPAVAPKIPPAPDEYSEDMESEAMAA